MAEQEYRIPKAMAQEVDMKTIQVDIRIPGLEIKPKLPLVGTAKLKDSCTVTKTFNSNSLEVIAVVTKSGMEDRFKYVVQKLPGNIVPDQCKIEFKDNQIILILHKEEPASWEIQMKKGLEQATD